jgi:hypothetical protein
MLKKNCIMRSCMMFIYCQVLLGDQMEACAIGRACGIYRGEGKGIQGGRRNMKKVLLRRPRHSWDDKIRMDLRNRVVCTGFICLWAGTNGGLS